MSDDEGKAFWSGAGCGAFGFTLLGFLLGSMFGIASAQDWCQRKAVEAGVGRWAADPATGKTRFVYGAGEGRADE